MKRLDVQHYRRPPIIALVYLAIALGLFICTSLCKYIGAGRDDVFVTLWAGKSLGAAPWFINYNGQLQESSSSILGALTARVSFFFFPSYLYLANKLVGWIAALGTLVLLWRHRCLYFHSHPDQLGSVSVLLVGLAPPFAYWSLGGLETSMYGFLILLFTGWTVRLWEFDDKMSKRAWRALAYGLLFVVVLSILCRPEGFWLVLAVAALCFLFRREARRTCRLLMQIVVVPATIFFGLLIAVRYHFTGAMFPNAVYAKVGNLDWARLLHGAGYVFSYSGSGFLAPMLAVTVIGGFAVVLVGTIRRAFGVRGIPALGMRWLIVSFVVVGYDAFVIIVGGDWMEYQRFMAPVLPATVILLLMGVETISADANPRQRRIGAGVLTTWLVIVVHGELTYHSAKDCSQLLTERRVKALLERPEETIIDLNCAHHRDNVGIRPFVENDLGSYVARYGQITILTGQAGYFPWLVREHFGPASVRLLDSAGLGSLAVAQARTRKSPYGNAWFRDLGAILAGEESELSWAVKRFKPSMIYETVHRRDSDSKLENLGFVNVYDVPGAVVYFKAPSKGDREHR